NMSSSRLSLPLFGPYLTANVRDVVFATTAFSGAISFSLGAMLIQPAHDANAVSASAAVVASASVPAALPVGDDFDVATLTANEPAHMPVTRVLPPAAIAAAAPASPPVTDVAMSRMEDVPAKPRSHAAAAPGMPVVAVVATAQTSTATVATGD